MLNVGGMEHQGVVIRLALPTRENVCMLVRRKQVSEKESKQAFWAHMSQIHTETTQNKRDAGLA